jgi:hypothetical protein
LDSETSSNSVVISFSPVETKRLGLAKSSGAVQFGLRKNL